ncbi:MAG: V4R domain-containing protein [Euryarchaeota archaeon]
MFFHADDLIEMDRRMSRSVSRLAFLVVRSIIWDMEADGETRMLAERLGREIVRREGISSVEEGFSVLKKLGCGDVRVNSEDDRTDERVHEMGYDTVTVYECISCSGAPEVGKTLCSLEGGLIEGIVSELKGNDYYAIEYACWGMGDERCSFALVPKGDRDGELRVKRLVRERASG